VDLARTGRVPRCVRPLFQILLLTGQRRSEVGGMRWEELRELGTEQALWELPGESNDERPAAPRAARACRSGAPLWPTANGAAGVQHDKHDLDLRLQQGQETARSAHHELRSENGLAPLPS
jgi:integrase